MTREDEFFSHVWDHTDDTFLNRFAQPKGLSNDEKSTLKEIICILCNKDDKTACNEIHEILKSQDPKNSIIPIILRLVGSTRSKILTDLRAMMANQSVKIPARPELLSKHPHLLPRVEKYLTDRLRRVFAEVIKADCKVDDDTLFMILDTMNNATWGGWIRQERAKRGGHYAERILAGALSDLGIPFQPVEKLEPSPKSDVTIDGISYDLVIPDTENPQMCFKCTVHTSNIGQYGESKDYLEIAQASKSIRESTRTEKPILIALIDGVGFGSNKRGLRNVLSHANEFVQFKTMWKVAVLYASRNAKVVELCIPDANEHAGFLERYRNHVVLRDASGSGYRELGEASLLIR